MGFYLFILTNAALFVRPSEVVPSLAEVNVYLILILTCAVVSIGRVLRQLSGAAIAASPITACVLAFWAISVLSLAVRADWAGAWAVGSDFGKVVLYYLLLVGLVDTPDRLRSLLRWLAVLCVLQSGVTLLRYHGYLEMPGDVAAVVDSRIDPETGKSVSYERLQGTGIFMDPNDLCLALSLGVLCCLANVIDTRAGMFRVAWLAPIVPLVYTLKLTESRGGLLGLLCGLVALCRARYGWKRTLPLAAVALPAAILLAGGRQASIDIGRQDDTAQGRIQLWAEGLLCLRHAPLFGVGANNYPDATGTGLVAHNSYVNAYTELGLVGGSVFVGLFYFALRPLEQLAANRSGILDPELRRLQPFVLAIGVAYAAGIWSLTRNYVIPTYLVVGLAVSFLGQVRTWPPCPSLRPGQNRLRQLAVVGVLSVVGLYLYVRVFSRYGPG